MSARMASRLLQVMAHIVDKGDDCASVKRICQACSMTTTQVSDACAVLRRNGLARHVKAQCYALTEAGRLAAERKEEVWRGPRKAIGVTKPRDNTLIQRAWNAMRIKRKFDLNEIAILAAQDEAEPKRSITQYCFALELAGYLLPVNAQGATRGRPGASKRYLLQRDTGPFAPRHRKALRLVVDMNSGESFNIQREANV